MARCNICNLEPHETPTKRLVVDHNHQTGRVRGWLCDLCNAWIERYERNLYSLQPKPMRTRVLDWFNKYAEKIDAHLKTDTGFDYRPGIDFFRHTNSHYDGSDYTWPPAGQGVFG